MRFLHLFVGALLLSPCLVRAQFALTKVADTNTSIPNGSGKFTGFSTLYGPAMSQGSVAFYATGTNGQKGYYIQTNGVLFRAVDTNTTAPGGGNFTSVSPFAYGFEGDSLYFGGVAASQSAMFIYSNNVITRLVDTNTTVPGTANKFGATLLLYPFDGRVAFHGQGSSSSQVGIYRLENGVVSKIADTNDNFPGGVGKMSFTTSAAEISHDANGAVAFFASDSAGGGRQGIFVGISNTLTRIASTDTTVPGRTNLFTGSNPIFSRKPDISAGKIVFVSRFSDGGSGVFQYNLDGTGGTVIATNAMQIPGTNVNFSSFNDAAIELGTVVFTAQGPGIWGAYRYQNGAIEKIIAKPEALDGKGIDQVILSNQGLNGGRLALQITFTNGSAGIYSTVVGFANQGNPGGTLGAPSFSPGIGISFTFTGELGHAYRLQFNTHLASTNWTTLTNFTYSAPVSVLDSGALGGSGRFYRAISP